MWCLYHIKSEAKADMYAPFVNVYTEQKDFTNSFVFHFEKFTVSERWYPWWEFHNIPHQPCRTTEGRKGELTGGGGVDME